jgi:hypothetical protein
LNIIFQAAKNPPRKTKVRKNKNKSTLESYPKNTAVKNRSTPRNHKAVKRSLVKPAPRNKHT